MDIVKELRGYADDPMWDAHCEMPKRLAKAAIDEIERLRALASQYRDDMRHPPAEDSRQRRIEMIDLAIAATV